MTRGDLATTEKTRFVALERTIDRGVGTFMEVGNALMEIRQRKLYRENFKTFEAYCQERWGFSRTRATQLVRAAKTATTVPVSNEHQARALAPLKEQPEAQKQAWEQAQAESNGNPTGEQVREAVARHTGKTPQVPKTEPCPTCGRPMRVDKPMRRRT